MATTRPMISLSGFSRKTSFDGPSLSVSGCSSYNCPKKRGTQLQHFKCDCDCGGGNQNILLRRQLFHQQKQQHQHLVQQRHYHHLAQQQNFQRNHHLLLLQLQAQNQRKPLKHSPLPIKPKRLTKNEFFPNPPSPPPAPVFRPTVSDSNSESDRDRESLEHFHRHLQQLHRITCASLENAIYFGGSQSGDAKSLLGDRGDKSSKTKSHKSFSFRDIRDIGKKKKIPTEASASTQHVNSQTSSSTLPSPSLTSSSSTAIKRRNTTRSAKDYIGVNRVKLLAKYWSKGKSSAADSGNGGSCSSSSGSGTSRNSDSGDSQLSNYSNSNSSSVDIGCSIISSPKINKAKVPVSSSTAGPTSLPSSNCTISSSTRATAANKNKSYPISQNNIGQNAVTYKVRYDIPSSWESEQLLSFGSINDHQSDHRHLGNDNISSRKCKTNKGPAAAGAAATLNNFGSPAVSSCSSDSITSVDHHSNKREQDIKICTHCGHAPSDQTLQSHKTHAVSSIKDVANEGKPRKTHIFKTLTFVKPQSQRPKDYSSIKEKHEAIPRTGKFNSNIKNSSSENKPTLVGLAASTTLPKSGVSNGHMTMVQQKISALGRSKSQKCTEKGPVFTKCPTSKLVHSNSLLVIPPKNAVSTITVQHPPKVRFKEHQLLHHRSEQCLSETCNQEESRGSVDKLSLLSKWGRRSSSSSATTPTVTAGASVMSVVTTPNSNMLPDDREYHSLYDCRIPRPKIKGIVPTHSYGVGVIAGSSGPSSPVSRCSSSVIGGDNICSGLRTRRYANATGEFVEFTEISLQDDDDSETSGFESEQNNTATTITTTVTNKDEPREEEIGVRRKQQAQRSIPAEMTPAGKYFTDFKTLYHYQDQQRLSVQKSPTPSRVLSFRKQYLPSILTRSARKKATEDPSAAAEFLKTLPIFRKLNDGFFSKLSDHITDVFYENGKYILRQGEKGDVMYFLLNGTAKATFKSLESRRSEEIFLKTLHPGDFFGERVFQTRNSYYTCNVVVSSEEGANCVRLDREAYEELMYKCHDFKIRAMDRSLQRKNKLPDEIAKIKLDDLRLVTTLGVGGFGRVELCTLATDSSRAFALKKMKKCQIVATRQIEHIRSEKSILLETNCDFICKLYKTFKDAKYLYMLMECCLGGELWTVLRDRGRFEDETAKFYIGCVIEALKYLHIRNIIYRDLKPENLLLGSDGYVKVVDFGFAKKLDGRKTWTFCGTPEYCAPEIILNKGHDLSADFWSLGVLMFELLTGTPPFTGGDPLRTYKIILQGIDAVNFPPTVGRYALNLIRKLCRDNPAERLGAQRGKISDIRKHKWFDGFDWSGLQTRTLTPPIIPDVRGPLDFGNFDEYPPDRSGSPPDDLSGWDWDF